MGIELHLGFRAGPDGWTRGQNRALNGVGRHFSESECSFVWSGSGFGSDESEIQTRDPLGPPLDGLGLAVSSWMLRS